MTIKALIPAGEICVFHEEVNNEYIICIEKDELLERIRDLRAQGLTYGNDFCISFYDQNIKGLKDEIIKALG